MGIERKLGNFAVPSEKGVEIFSISCENEGVGFVPSLVFTMKRSAFTLVELLAVVVVIALLVAILIPALSGARTAARTTQCISRQRDLALAMITYSGDNNGLPGYLNKLGDTPVHSWAVAVFPMIGENKRYEFLLNSPIVCKTTEEAEAREKEEEKKVNQAIMPLPALLCPADADKQNVNGCLSYVVNCGPVGPDRPDNDNETNGNKVINGDNAPVLTLFKDRRSGLTSINTKVPIEEIRDGMSNTILLSENLDAGFWHKHMDFREDALVSGENNVITKRYWYGWTDSQIQRELQQQKKGSEYTRDKVSVDDLGFIWSFQKKSRYAPNVFTYDENPQWHDRVPRPSSKHPGLVVAAYADGTAKKINDDISPDEWLNAVCPDDKWRATVCPDEENSP